MFCATVSAGNSTTDAERSPPNKTPAHALHTTDSNRRYLGYLRTNTGKSTNLSVCAFLCTLVGLYVHVGGIVGMRGSENKFFTFRREKALSCLTCLYV